MPRNGSGTYNLPSPPTPWVTGTTISAPDMNTAQNDIASALTQSVSADGQTPMTGDLNLGGHNITNGGTINATGYTLSGQGIFNLVRGYIGGMALANDGVSPNTVLDVAAGVCVSSSQSAFITFASTFKKSISGAWTAGSGNNGMGQGLTATASTWYHVYAIVNGGANDIYFDTSVSAANAPAGTTASRRIGTIFLDGSTHITTFAQHGDTFLYGTPFISYSGTINNSLTTLPLSTPLGIITTAIVSILNSNAAPFLFSAGPTFQALNVPLFGGAGGGVSYGCYAQIDTDTSQRINVQSSVNGSTTAVNTLGWIDTRGRFS